MKKILDWFRTNFGSFNTEPAERTPSHTAPGHHKDGLFLNKQQLNRTIVLLLITSLFVFVGGYFWGQHSAAEQLLTMVERDSFADQVYYSMCSVNERGDDEGDAEDSSTQLADASDDAASKAADVAPAEVKAAEIVVAKNESAENPKIVIAENKQNISEQKQRYKGVLAGFSTEKMANQLVARLKRRGFDVGIVTRQSRAKNGRVVSWYQAVTAPTADRKQLEQTIAQIKKFEKLHDVSITSIS